MGVEPRSMGSSVISFGKSEPPPLAAELDGHAHLSSSNPWSPWARHDAARGGPRSGTGTLYMENKMEKKQIGSWLIEFDRAATKTAYAAIEGDSCKCQSCRNFYEAIPQFPVEVRQFFDEFGVDLTEPVEIYDLCEFKDGLLLYGGWYHIVGNYLDGDNVTSPYTIVDGFQIWFTKSQRCSFRML